MDGNCLSSHQKCSRWDRISKRHTLTGNAAAGQLKTATVRRFLKMDFIENMTIQRQPLNPCIVMDVRHKIFRQTSKMLPQTSLAAQRSIEHCVTHNAEVEDHYINNELNKFRQQLRRYHRKQDFSTMESNVAKEIVIVKSATEKGELTDISGPQLLDYNERTRPASKPDPVRTPSPLTPTEELLRPMRAAVEQHNLGIQGKRFEMQPNLIEVDRENSPSSNTSEGIDSVISDLAEEALLELQREDEACKEELAAKANASGEKEAASNGDVEDTSTTCVSPTEVVDGSLITQNYQPTPVNAAAAIAGAEDGENVSNAEQNLIIEELFLAPSHSHADMLRNCFLKWIHFTTIEKIQRDNCSSRNDRVIMINTFLDKIRKEKRRLCAAQTIPADKLVAETNGTAADREVQPALKVNKKYQNKIKVQQDIINLQRLKLERQERVIMELQLSKLSNEAKDARQAIKDELKLAITYGDPKIKPKAKTLQVLGDLREEHDDPLARLQAKGALLVPKFLQNMQDRSLERSVRHEHARQRRMQHEAEREALKLAAEEAKRQEDDEVKRARIRALTEKRQQEKMLKILKEAERQRAIQQQRKAKEFYSCHLRRIGLECFKRLLQLKRNNLQKCEQFRRRRYKQAHFVAWRHYCDTVQEYKNTRADDFYYKLVKREALASWRTYLLGRRSLYNDAVDWYEMRLTDRIFGSWLSYTKSTRMIEDTKMLQAVSHYEWHLKWKVLDCWQRLPQIMLLEKETEERRQRWRLKIWELLPDYKPCNDFICN